jgi:DNA-binding winged helix-turn-helix (wHTH) protein
LLYSFEDFSLDTARRELRRSGALIAFQPQVFDLLEYSIRNRERVVTKTISSLRCGTGESSRDPH